MTYMTALAVDTCGGSSNSGVWYLDEQAPAACRFTSSRSLQAEGQGR